MPAIVIWNVIFAAICVFIYAILRWGLGWFKGDHLKVPEWMSLLSIPLGLAVPASKGAIDGMCIVALAIFGNEWLWQRLKISPLGWAIDRADRWVIGRFRRLLNRIKGSESR